MCLVRKPNRQCLGANVCCLPDFINKEPRAELRLVRYFRADIRTRLFIMTVFVWSHFMYTVTKFCLILHIHVLSCLSIWKGNFFVKLSSWFCPPVAQLVENCVSNVNVMGFDPLEIYTWITIHKKLILKSIALMQLKSNLFVANV